MRSLNAKSVIDFRQYWIVTSSRISVEKKIKIFFRFPGCARTQGIGVAQGLIGICLEFEIKLRKRYQKGREVSKVELWELKLSKSYNNF